MEDEEVFIGLIAQALGPAGSERISNFLADML
jgi:hypothetical protein